MPWVASGPQTDVNRGNLTLNLPAGLQEGDLLITVVHYGGQAVHGLVDWNQIVQFNGGGTSSRLSVWWHRWTGTAPNLIVTHTSNNNPGIAGVAAFRGISSVLTIGATRAGTDSSIEHQSIDPPQDNVEVLAINGAADNNSRTLPSGWTPLFEDPVSGTQHAYVFDSSESPDESISMLHRVLATGATGTVVSTMNSSDPWASVLIALAPELLAAHVGMANLEVPIGARRSFVSIAAAETPIAARRSLVSFATTDQPLASRRGSVSVAVVQVPVEAARALISVASTQVPVEAARALISIANTQIPVAARHSRVSVSNLQTPIGGRRGAISVGSIQTPEAARESRISIAEWLVPLGQRAAAASFAVIQIPVGARRGAVSTAEYSLGDPGSDVARELKRARLARMPDHIPLRSTILLNSVETIIGDSSGVAPSRTPFVRFMPSPEPSRAIGIVRVFARIQVHQGDFRTPPIPHQYIISLFRESDMSLIGGVALDQHAIPGTTVVDDKESERIWTPEEFVLAPNDSLIVAGEVLGRQGQEYLVGLFMAIAWR